MHSGKSPNDEGVSFFAACVHTLRVRRRFRRLGKSKRPHCAATYGNANANCDTTIHELTER
jgi:hypothetical protein